MKLLFSTRVVRHAKIWLAAGMFLGALAVSAAERNYLHNPDFSEDAREWSVVRNGPGQDIPVETHVSGKSYEIRLGGATKPGYIRLCQNNILLPPDSRCRLNAVVDVENGGRFWITIQQPDGIFLYHYPHSLKKGRNEISTVFYSPGTQAAVPVNLLFQIGAWKGKNVFSGLSLLAEKNSPQEKVFRAGKEYHPVVMRNLMIKSGSALDLSAWNETAGGDLPRVAATPDGKLATTGKKNVPVRLFGYNCLNLNWGETDNRKFQEEVNNLLAATRRQGYNYLRLWLNDMVSHRNGVPFGVPEKNLERFDFILETCRKNGIYINLLMTSSNLFCTEKERNAVNQSRIHTNRLLMYLRDERLEKSWKFGVSLLNYVGPYSKTAIKDHPCIVEIEGFNEQYAGLALQKQIRHTHPAEHAKFVAAWNRFLSEKYAKQFSGEPIPENSSRYFNDYALFCEKLVTDLDQWYVEQLRRIGYRGLIVQNNYKNLLYRSAAWQTMNALNDHSYYVHPQTYMNIGSRVGNASSLATAIPYLRELAAGRFDSRPYLVGEYNHSFWNAYQYESGAAWGAYASFQDFSGFNIHSTPVIDHPTGFCRINNFNVGNNPVARGGEFLNAVLFRRGDVKPSSHLATQLYSIPFLRTAGNAMKAPSTEQSMLSLLMRYSLAFPDLPVPDGISRGRKPDLALTPSGLAGIIDHDWFASVQETQDLKFSLVNTIAQLRKQGVLPRENQTDAARGVFQSDTGEITLKTKESQLLINTPRTEVFVSPAGKGAAIGAFKVHHSSVDSCAGITSLDGAPLEKSRRLVLVYTTRAANSEMRLSADETTLLAPGYAPVLLRTGKLSAELRNKNENLTMYALALNGERREKIPLKKMDSVWKIEIDTAQLKEPPVFFEITE